MRAMTGRARLDLLLPLPRKVEPRQGVFELGGSLWLSPPPGFASPALERLSRELERMEIALGKGPRAIELVLDGKAGHPREGYALTIEPERIRVVASKGIGLNHGIRTLLQIVRSASGDQNSSGGGPLVLPALAIEDSPVFERRGVMLDVSR